MFLLKKDLSNVVMYIFPILILGFIIRLFSLNQSLWLDEATTGLVAQMNVTEILTKFSPGDFHPPLYYLFIKYWTSIFGYSEISLRFPSVLLSLGTIYLVYKLWEEKVEKKSAWIPALFLATSGLFIYYSQEARMYMFSTFLVILAIFSFVKILKEKSGVGYWIIFSLVLPILSLSDYLPNLIFPVFWFFGWSKRKNSNLIKKFLMSHIILITAWTWWLPMFIIQLRSGFGVSISSPPWWEVLGKFSFKNLILIPLKFIIGRVSLDNHLLYVFVSIFLLVVFLLLVLKSFKSFKKAKIFFLWFLVPLILTTVISFKLSVLNYFRLLFILPAFYILVSIGILNLKKRQKIAAIVFVLAVNLLTSSMYLLNTKFQREDWRGVVRLSEPVVFSSNSQQEGYLYYSKGKKPFTIETVDLKSDIIWLVRYVWEISDPGDTARQKIEGTTYEKIDENNFNGVLLYKYEKSDYLK